MPSPTDHLPRLGDFVIGRELGRGGMGVVYEAVQTSLNRKVALKVLRDAGCLPTSAVQRFHREAEAAAKLHHSNIVPIYTTGEQDGIHFYAMELIEGPSLDRVIRQLRGAQPATPAPRVPDRAGDSAPDDPDATGPYVATPAPSLGSGSATSTLTSGDAYFDTVARMVAEVADALDYAHRNGVVHRDIKPSNLLLSPAGRLCVSDFGLARVTEQPGMTITGEMVGTPRYMSPEQIAAGRVPVDHRTDIYSLGATLYELLTLQAPFAAEHREQLLAQIINQEPRPPRRVDAKVPVDLETICLKAMDKDPARRYPSAGQMAEDLRRYLSRFAILARRAGPLTKARKWVKRNPHLAAALAGVLVCAGLAGGLAYQAYRERKQHDDDLLAEQRRSALDKALVLSRLEDFDGARQAIREAERLGCSPGEVRMRRGQLELYQGHLNEAIADLRQAVEWLPESVAARAMLSVAYYKAARVTASYRTLSEAARLTPVSPEDLLFLGYAESFQDPDRALRHLAEAVRRRPNSLIALLIHTDVLRLHVLDSPDLENAKTITDNVRVIKRQIPDNVMALNLSLAVHTVCYHVYDELRQPALREAAVTEGLRDAEALKRFGTSPAALLSRWVFFEEIGQPEAAFADLRKASTESKAPPFIFYHGGHLYKRGDYAEAARVFGLCQDQTFIDLLRVIALAERPDELASAEKLYREIAARDLNGWDLFNSQLILRFLGRKTEAVEVSRKFLEKPERFPPLRQEAFRSALEYCAGQRPAESLILSLGGKRHGLSNAYLCLGLTALADGDRATARWYLQLCEGTRYFDALPYSVSQMLLSRMDHDQTWPRWITPAK
jgi:tetratricopeptide (TPR) repeat protein